MPFDPDPAASSTPDDSPIDLEGAPVSWPPLPAGLPGPVGIPPSGTTPGRPPPGLLDVLLPWSALTGGPAAEPAALGRIGPVTPSQVRQLIGLATHHPGTVWRLLLLDDDGYAQAIERIRVRGSPADQIRAGPPTTPVIGRMTVTISASAVSRDQHNGGTGLRASLLRAAARAAGRVQARQVADTAAGGCAHRGATTAYRPGPRLREFVVARDGTCTFPPCGQPAWRADLDHTLPWHLGGPTCACNLSAGCRTHHKIKQLPDWKLDQPQPGILRWTTPAGRSYTVQPNRYPS